MFSLRELDSIDTKYFKIISKNQNKIEIKSKNTRHCWILIPTVNHTGKTIKIMHTHFQNRPYHDHENAATLYSATKKIKHHDLYQLRYRKSEYGK